VDGLGISPGKQNPKSSLPQFLGAGKEERTVLEKSKVEISQKSPEVIEHLSLVGVGRLGVSASWDLRRESSQAKGNAI